MSTLRIHSSRINPFNVSAKCHNFVDIDSGHCGILSRYIVSPALHTPLCTHFPGFWEWQQMAESLSRYPMFMPLESSEESTRDVKSRSLAQIVAQLQGHPSSEFAEDFMTAFQPNLSLFPRPASFTPSKMLIFKVVPLKLSVP